MAEKRRIVITGMSINTPLGDTLDEFLQNLLDGRSAITHWKLLDSSRISSKIGGELYAYDVSGKISSLREQIPDETASRLPRLIRNSPWSLQLSVLVAVAAFLDADLFTPVLNPERLAAIIAGHNLNEQYYHQNWERFVEYPDYSDALLALKGVDTDHAGCVAEILGIHGPIYTVGGACASGNVALRSAMDEIRHHEVDIALVVGAVYEFSPVTLHSFARLGAISCTSFNDEPARASRPFDVGREGFVASHGSGALVVEELGHALARGARIYGEILGAELRSAASRSPYPSEEHEALVMEQVVRKAGIDRQEIDFVSAHATSTVVGDVTEIRAIKRAFGDHAGKLKINAPKSMLGHTLESAAVVETVAAVLQMRAGRLHPSINIDRLDPEIDLDVCANGSVEHPVRCLLNNSFGFGGINSASIIGRFDGSTL
ncbi:MAG TPA: beta-ketoacyl-[acyl-carrier-protein] synthase family protein [Syntrophobacteraceae bacterium]|nr:beta-ketoacyl-[acyl-carrier-protein] synthase family protein [Syntrophobacteraceae bacterium]